MFFLRFRQLCDEVNKSTTAVAQELGVSKSTVSYWRNTEGAIPKQEVIAKIAEYFSVSIDYLLGNTDIKSPQPTSEDDELLLLLDELRNRPDMKMLFSVSKNCTPDEVRQAVKIIEALRKDDSYSE